MKVKELKEKLAELDENLYVWLSDGSDLFELLGLYLDGGQKNKFVVLEGLVLPNIGGSDG